MKSKEKIPRIIKEEWNFDENGFKRVFRKSFDKSEDLLVKLGFSVAPHFSAGSSNSN
jgi:hypothetical protein